MNLPWLKPNSTPPTAPAVIRKRDKSRDAEIKAAYIAFRSDPKNIKLSEQWFCNKHFIAIASLHSIIAENPDIESTLNSREVTDEELSSFLGSLTRLCYEKAFMENIPVKSLEGLTNALVNLMKHRQLAAGRPTEIISVKEEELKLKTPRERYQLLMGYLRRPSVN